MAALAATAHSSATAERFQLTDHLRQLAAAARDRAMAAAGCRRGETQTEAYFGAYADLPLAERQARSLAAALVAEPVAIFPGERLHGMFYLGGDPQWHHHAWGDQCAVLAAQQRTATELPELAELVNQHPAGAGPGESYLLDDFAAPGHIAWNWHWVLERGLDDLLAEVRTRRDEAVDPEAQAFHAGVAIVIEAVLAWHQRHVDALRERLATAVGDERERLAASLAVCERVPAGPARGFHEALQSFYTLWLAVMYEVPYGGNSPGRMDYYLWPYLRDELADGRLSYQEAGELLAELFIKTDERVHRHDGHVNTIVVGGRGPDGEDAVSPLSFLMLDVFEQLDLTHPAVYTRVSQANPAAWQERCAAYLLHGGNRAQLLADEPILAAMCRDDRMPERDAAMYMCGGCMELNPHGMNSDLLFAFYYNTPKTLELALTGGHCLTTGARRLTVDGGLAQCADFEAFYALFLRETRRALETKFRQLDLFSEEMARCRPAFLQSSLVSDCLERGRNVQAGGARYNDYGGTPLGLQNVADSLYAVEQAVYVQGFCTPETLLAALAADFVGHEALRARLLALPKYGQGQAGADAMMARVVSDVCGIFDGWRNRHGGRVKPIIFTFVWAPQMGRSLGASPDGRHAGQPIGHGLTPTGPGLAGGLTAAMGSYLTLPADRVAGGASTMWDFDASWVNEALLGAVVSTFTAQGGQIFQGTTTSVDDLEQAMARPADYPHLIVRVGGFSARFTGLGSDLQEEIIRRHRHRG